MPAWPHRVDVRLGLWLAGAIGCLLVALMSLFFLIATHETVELLAEQLDRDLTSVAANLDVRDDVALRRVDASGGIHPIQGVWPQAARSLPVEASSLRLAFARDTDHLVAERPLAKGARLEAALSLASFAAERTELLAQILWSLGFGLLGLIAVAAFSTRIALAPLREATRAAERVDERHLDARIPMRGTGDDLDRHALALNRVLQRLEEAFGRVSAFSADVAHELRTPVNRILNLADLAIVGAAQGETPGELVALREGAEEMRRVIDDLLLLAKGDGGRIDVRGEEVPLATAASELAELFRPSCEERGIALSLRAVDPRIGTFGDRGLLQRAISNLLDNAIRHTPPGGEIEMTVAPAGRFSAEILVSDSGPGFAEEDRERVFDRFVQLDSTRSSGGAGLGLALVRMIARLHGGEARAERGALGGACFKIRLPRFQ